MRTRAVVTARVRRVLVAVATGGSWGAIIAVRLFAGGTVGMADNGDSRRLMCELGVRALKPFSADPSRYVYPVWVAHRWYGEACGADGSGEPYRSSELWLLSLAKHLTPVLGLRGALNLEALGIICAVLVGVATGLAVLVLPGSLVRRVVVASLLGLVAADAAVAPYFVSPYSEPAALVGALLLCVALLFLWRRGSTTWPGLVTVALVGAFTMAAKTQSASLLPALILALLWLPHHRLGETDEPAPAGPAFAPPRWSGPQRGLARRGPGLLTSAALVVVAVVVVHSAPHRFDQVDAYDEVFNEILVHSAHPAADLRALGVDPGLAYARGSNVLSPNSAATSPAYLQFRGHVSQSDIAEFYLTHPGRLLPAAADGLDAMATWRQGYLGTYVAGSAHPPGAVEDRVGVYTALFEGTTPIILVMWWLATLAFGLFAARDRRVSRADRAMGRLAVVLAVAAFCEFWAVVLGEGRSDINKHMILANEVLALAVPALATCVWSRLRVLARTLREAPISPGTTTEDDGATRPADAPAPVPS